MLFYSKIHLVFVLLWGVSIGVCSHPNSTTGDSLGALYTVPTLTILADSVVPVTGKHLFIYKDTQQKDSLKSIQQLPSDVWWQPQDLAKIGLGFSDAAWWVYFKVKNKGFSEDYILELGHTLLEDATLYSRFVGETQWEQQKNTGKHFVQGDAWNGRFPAFKVALAPGEEKEFMLRTWSVDRVDIGLKLGTRDSFFIKNYISEMTLYLFYGLLLGLVIYNLFYGLWLKNKVYLVNSANIFFYLAFQFEQHGLLQLFLGQQYYRRMTPQLISLAVIGAVGFAKIFACPASAFPQRAKWVSRNLWAAAALLVLSVVLPMQVAIVLGVLLAALSSVHMFYTGYVGMKDGYRQSKFFFVSWMFFLAGVIIYSVRSGGYISANWFTDSAIQIGAVITTVLFSLGEADVTDRLYRLTHLQKNQLSRQKDVIENHRKELEQEVARQTLELRDKNKILEEKSMLIDESLNYAEHIQKTVFSQYWEKQAMHSAHFFMQNRPRQDIGGDFLWARNMDGGLLYVLADCTGHGVPGALVSLSAVSVLENLVAVHGTTDLGMLLTRFNQNMRKALQQGQAARYIDGNFNEGMDVGLVLFKPHSNMLEYAGAKLPLYLHRGGKLELIPANKRGIGYRPLQKSPDYEFERHCIQLMPGDAFYMFTDGFLEQLGGSRQLPYGKRRLFSMLEEIAGHGPEEKRSHLWESFSNYANEAGVEQMDDVTYLGYTI